MKQYYDGEGLMEKYYQGRHWQQKAERDRKRKAKYKKERILKLKEIIGAIDFWLAKWSKGEVAQEVGAVVQRHAMREVAFLEFIRDDYLSMDELRNKANKELVELGEPFVPKPMPTLLVPSMVDFKVELPSWLLPPKKKTRREELEEMSALEVNRVYRKARVKEQKKERIMYILESEKEYK
jgi:hypothetical protein